MLNEISCPLCGEKRYITHRHFKVSELSRKWQSNYGFDPFKGHEIGDVITKLQCIECQLIYYTPLFLGDADFYSILSKNNWYYEDVKWEFNEAIKLILDNKPKSLLEIGCGDGNFLRKINHAVENAEGLEINEVAIKNCINNGLKVSSKKLEQVTEQFDAVAMFEVLEHLDDLNNVINQIIRITNKGGIIMIAVPNPDSYLKDIDIVLLDMPPHHSSGWSLKTFDYLAKKYNLERIHYGQEPLRDVHYQGMTGTKFMHEQRIVSAAPNNVGFTKRLSGRIRNFFMGIFLSVMPPFLSRIDYLSYKLEKGNTIGHTHLVVFKKL